MDHRQTTSIRISSEGKKRAKILAATHDLMIAELYELLVGHVWALEEDVQKEILTK